MLVGAAIIFSLAIVCLTITQSLLLTSWVVIPVFIILTFFGYRKKILLKTIVIFFASMLLAFLSVVISFTRYNRTIFMPVQALIESNNGYHTIIATGTIVEKQTHNRYLRKSFNNVPFFLYTSRNHSP